MYALFNADDLLARHCGQLTLDGLLAEPAVTVATVVGSAIMPEPWELIPREDITGQGVLGA